MYKKYCYSRTLPLWNGKDPDSDPYQIGNQDPDPDPYRSESRIRIRIKRAWILNTGFSHISVSNSRIWIQIKVKSRIRIKRVWICNIGFIHILPKVWPLHYPTAPPPSAWVYSYFRPPKGGRSPNGLWSAIWHQSGYKSVSGPRLYRVWVGGGFSVGSSQKNTILLQFNYYEPIKAIGECVWQWEAWYKRFHSIH